MINQEAYFQTETSMLNVQGWLADNQPSSIVETSGLHPDGDFYFLNITFDNIGDAVAFFRANDMLMFDPFAPPPPPPPPEEPPAEEPEEE